VCWIACCPHADHVVPSCPHRTKGSAGLLYIYCRLPPSNPPTHTVYPPPQLPLDLFILTLNCAEKKEKNKGKKEKTQDKRIIFLLSLFKQASYMRYCILPSLRSFAILRPHRMVNECLLINIFCRPWTVEFISCLPEKTISCVSYNWRDRTAAVILLEEAMMFF